MYGASVTRDQRGDANAADAAADDEDEDEDDDEGEGEGEGKEEGDGALSSAPAPAPTPAPSRRVLSDARLRMALGVREAICALHHVARAREGSHSHLGGGPFASAPNPQIPADMLPLAVLRVLGAASRALVALAPPPEAAWGPAWAQGGAGAGAGAGASASASALAALSRSADAPSHGLGSALASVLSDPLAVVAHALALASGRGWPAWPLLTRALVTAPRAAP